MSHEKLLHIDLSDILIEKSKNTRRNYPTEEMGELMQSIKQHGVMQPAGVRISQGHPGKYELMFGYRRYFASKKLGNKTLKCVLFDAEDNAVENERKAYFLNAIENMVRTDPPVAEQGRVFAGLIKEGLTVTEIAVRVGISKNRVQMCIDMHERLPDKFRNRVKEVKGRKAKRGTIPASTAKLIMHLQDTYELKDEHVDKLMDIVKDSGFSTEHIRVMSTQLDKGDSFSEAFKTAKSCRMVAFNIPIMEANIKALEKERGFDIRTIIFDMLASKPSLGVIVPKGKVMVRRQKAS